MRPPAPGRSRVALLLAAWLLGPFALSVLLARTARAEAMPPSPPVLRDRDGQPVALSQAIVGDWTLVVFWRADSRPSREALIHLHQRRGDLEDLGVAVLAVTPSPAPDAEEILRGQGLSFRNLYDTDASLASRWNLGYVFPSLVLLDRNLVVVGIAEGGGPGFDASLNRLLSLTEREPEEAEGRGVGFWKTLLVIVLAALAAVAIEQR